MKKILFFSFAAVLGLSFWFLYSEIYTAEAQKTSSVTFQVGESEDIGYVAKRLADEQVVRSAWLFRKYLVWKGIDTQVRAGEYVVEAPITLYRVAQSLKNPSISERTITIIPGWDLRDIAEYFVEQGIATTTDGVYAYTGEPTHIYTTPTRKDEFDFANDFTRRPITVSLEGYLAPETYRIYKDASLEQVIAKLMLHRNDQVDYAEVQIIERSTGRTWHEILTIASILEREVRSSEDRKKVADLFWRRYDMNWALQADSTVHYVVNKKGNIATTSEDRNSLSPYNTYKYPGLPPGPICNPSLDSIKAAMYPEENEYWYFLTTLDTGEVKYARDLEEHNENVNKYLR